MIINGFEIVLHDRFERARHVTKTLEPVCAQRKAHAFFAADAAREIFTETNRRRKKVAIWVGQERVQRVSRC
jgi:hypothetical protein